jgi:CHAT domain-containing protein
MPSGRKVIPHLWCPAVGANRQNLFGGPVPAHAPLWQTAPQKGAMSWELAMGTAKATSFAVVLLCLGVLPGATLLLLIAMGPAVAQHVDVAAIYKRWQELFEAGNYPAALVEAQRYEAEVKAQFGINHPNYATSLNALAVLYKNQARYADAEPLYKRALAIYEKASGPNHPSVAVALNNLALLHETQGRYADAEPLFKRALAIHEKEGGPATVLGNLAMLYEEQGRYADAEPLEKRALAIREKALGPNHPYVAVDLNNLATLYQRQGRNADAESLEKRALAISEKSRGPSSPDVATQLDNLAYIYRAQSRYGDAEPLHRRSLAIREKALGPDHPDVATSLNHLALLYDAQGRYADAEPLYKRALAIDEKAFGPDHPDVAGSLESLASLYDVQGRYADAEPLFRRSLAIREKALGPDHPAVANSLNHLALLYDAQGRYADALPLAQRVIPGGRAVPASVLPVLLGAEHNNLISAEAALDGSLNVLQRASQTVAGEALNALALRFSAGNDRLAELVRKDQDLAAEAGKLDKSIIAAVSAEPSRRDAAKERRIRDRIAAIGKERDDLQAVFMRDFPDYAALSKPQPLTLKDIQALLTDDEALVIIDLGSKDAKSYVWAITRSVADWKESAVTAGQVSETVSRLRSLLNEDSRKPFDTKLSFELYRQVFGPVENIVGPKARWSLVLNGALTSLPPQVLVTSDPAGQALKDVDWLIRAHAVTVLPSVSSFKVLRSKAAAAEAKNPLIGFADPVFDRDLPRLQQNSLVMASLAVARGVRGAIADIAVLRKALPALPETANELKQVAASVKASDADVILGPDATETRVKRSKLDQYRIVYFATHGLLAGEVSQFAKLNAEPALVLSLPAKPTELDDGLLTASEVAQLKLSADWVVLSACNTAAGDKPGAEALSGLARAFFYAGGRSLLVSHWEVETNSAVALMTGTFAALAANPQLSHGEALRQSMLAMINHPQQPNLVEPKYWAPFVVVGEPAKPTP